MVDGWDRVALKVWMSAGLKLLWQGKRNGMFSLLRSFDFSYAWFELSLVRNVLQRLGPVQITQLDARILTETTSFQHGDKSCPPSILANIRSLF